jgi:Transposase DDE domain
MALNYLIDIENAVIVDVEATPARTYDEVAATQTMLERTEERFDLKPKRLAADTAYVTGKILGWLVKEKKITPHIPVWEKSDRQDGVFSRSDFQWDKKREVYICPNGKRLHASGTVHGGRTLLYRASKRDRDACPSRASHCRRARHDASEHEGKRVDHELRESAWRCGLRISRLITASSVCGFVAFLAPVTNSTSRLSYGTSRR